MAHDDRPHNGTTVIYNQHELTAAEIARDKGRQRAIDRNRAKANRSKGTADPRTMTEMRYHTDRASETAKGWFEKLLGQCETIAPDVHARAAAWWPTVKDTINKQDISTAINRMKERILQAQESGANHTPATPSAPVAVSAESARGWQARAPRDPFTDVPDGYYAVDTDEGHLAFYRVSTWKRSGDRKVQVQASDELHPVKGHKATDAILAKVRKDTPEVAGLRYAREIGNCWRCGRTLTDEVSRARGIGPVCVNK